MSAIERAAEVIAGVPEVPITFCGDIIGDETDAPAVALALADAGLLVTDEIQAVLDAEAAMTRYLFVDPVDQAILRDRLQHAVDAYLASREPW